MCYNNKAAAAVQRPPYRVARVSGVATKGLTLPFLEGGQTAVSYSIENIHSEDMLLKNG